MSAVRQRKQSRIPPWVERIHEESPTMNETVKMSSESAAAGEATAKSTTTSSTVNNVELQPSIELSLHQFEDASRFFRMHREEESRKCRLNRKKRISRVFRSVGGGGGSDEEPLPRRKESRSSRRRNRFRFFRHFHRAKYYGDDHHSVNLPSDDGIIIIYKEDAAVPSVSSENTAHNGRDKFSSGSAHDKFDDQSLPGEHDEDSFLWSDDESLLSAYDSSDEEEDEFIHRSYRGMARLQKQFERREQILQTLLEGKGAEYEKMIRERERQCRDKLLKTFQEKQRQKSKSVTRDSQPSIISANSSSSSVSDCKLTLAYRPTLLMKLKQLLLFEVHHTSKGCIALVFDCLGHAAFHGFLYSMLGLIGKSSIVSNCIGTSCYHFGLVFLGASLMRMNGNLWEWADETSYRLVKFDMHNRARLGSFVDAKVCSYLKRRNQSLNSFVNLMGFYVTYIGASYFYTLLDESFIGFLEEWWKTVEETVRAYMEAEEASCSAIDNSTVSVCLASTIDESTPVTCDDIGKYLLPPEHSPWIYYVCLDYDWSIPYCFFHGSLLMVSMTVMYFLGTDFLLSA